MRLLGLSLQRTRRSSNIHTGPSLQIAPDASLSHCAPAGASERARSSKISTQLIPGSPFLSWLFPGPVPNARASPPQPRPDCAFSAHRQSLCDLAHCACWLLDVAKPCDGIRAHSHRSRKPHLRAGSFHSSCIAWYEIHGLKFETQRGVSALALAL